MDNGTTSKRRNAMRDQLELWDGKTRVWSPTSEAEGAYNPKVVTGRLLYVEEWDTDNGPARVAILADDIDGQETVVFTNGVVLRQAWETYQPKIGDRIGVAYGGKEESKRGKEYNRYRLTVERGHIEGAAFGNAPLAAQLDDPFADQ